MFEGAHDQRQCRRMGFCACADHRSGKDHSRPGRRLTNAGQFTIEFDPEQEVWKQRGEDGCFFDILVPVKRHNGRCTAGITKQDQGSANCP